MRGTPRLSGLGRCGLLRFSLIIFGVVIDDTLGDEVKVPCTRTRCPSNEDGKIRTASALALWSLGARFRMTPLCCQDLPVDHLSSA